MIEGWPAFVAEFPDLEPVVQDLAGQGLAFGVHTIISTPRWTELKSRVRDYLGTKVEFRLGDVNETQVDRMTRDIPANRPGRAISGEKHHLMMGVPRLDGGHCAAHIVPAITAAWITSRRCTPMRRRGSGCCRSGSPGERDPAPPGTRRDYRTLDQPDRHPESTGGDLNNMQARRTDHLRRSQVRKTTIGMRWPGHLARTARSRSGHVADYRPVGPVPQSTCWMPVRSTATAPPWTNRSRALR